MRRLLTLFARVVLAAAVVGIVRAVLIDRSPQRSLHGSEPVIGSIDTWPQVPRRPTD